MLFKHRKLLRASLKGDLQRVQACVARGAKTHYREPWEGSTALHLAVLNGHTELCRLLILCSPIPSSSMSLHSGENGGRIVTRIRDRGGYTALHWAVLYGHTQTVAVLIQADPMCAYIPDSNGQTPLHWAVRYEFCDICRLLVRWSNAFSPDGIELRNVKDASGMTYVL